MKNLFDISKLDLREEFFETLASGANVRVERIVSNLHSSPKGFWYNQDEAEFVCLLQGEAELEFKEGGELKLMRAGDFILIGAHVLHRVRRTSKNCVWLAVFADFNKA